MKFKIGILIVIVAWCFVWGVGYYQDAFSAVKQYRSVSSEVKECKASVKESDKQLADLKQQSKYETADCFTIAQSVDGLASSTVSSVAAKKLNGSKGMLTIATVNSIEKVVNFTEQVDCMCFTLETENIAQALEEIETLNYCYSIEINQAVGDIQLTVFVI